MSVPTFLYLCLVGAVTGWIIGASLAQPGYLSEGLRGLWAVYVRLYRAVVRR